MAGRIYLTGDTHGKFFRFKKDQFYEQEELDKDDYVIICGDFGLIWDRCSKSISDGEKNKRGSIWETECEKWWLDWLENKSFTLLFVDGNHENFDRLDSYAVEEWNGGKVHKIRPSVIHLMRGQVYEIAGKRIFTFGGARSTDIQGGVLDPEAPHYRVKKRALDIEYINYRINHVSWWKEEMPSKEEMEEGIHNLAKSGNSVDYIITHCGPKSLLDIVQEKKRCISDDDTLIDYFEYIHDNVKYNKWYFGHYHKDEDITEKETVLYRGIIRIGDGAKRVYR